MVLAGREGSPRRGGAESLARCVGGKGSEMGESGERSLSSWVDNGGGGGLWKGE